MRINTIGNMSLGTTSDLGQLAVVNDVATDVGLVVQGVSGQTANLQEWRNSTGTLLANVDKDGRISAFNGTDTSPGLRFQGSANSGFYLWNGQVISTSGGNWSFLFGNNKRNYINTTTTGTAGLTVVPGVATDTGLVVQGAASQTANLQEWRNSSGVVVSSLNADGRILTLGDINTGNTYSNIILRGGYNSGSTVLSLSSGGSNPSVIGSGSNNALILGSGSGAMFCTSANCTTPLGYINHLGQMKVGAVGPITSQLDVIVGQPARIGNIIQGAASQTANLQEWRNSSGTVLSSVNNNGTLMANGGIATSAGALTLSSATGNIATGNDIVFNSGGSQYLEASYTLKTVKLASHGRYDTIYIGHDGISGQAGNVVVGQSTGTSNARLHVKGANLSPGITGMIVQGATGQTADLQQWQDSNGVVLAKIDATGNLTVKSASVQGDLVVTGNNTFNGSYITFSNNIRGYNVTVSSGATSQTVSFGTAHPDANYAVFCTPNWNTSCYVTNKTANGFTLNYGTAAPASQLVDWFVIR